MLNQTLILTKENKENKCLGDVHTIHGNAEATSNAKSG